MQQHRTTFSRWLFAAGCYNLLWGAWVVLMPHAMFDWTGMPRLNRPEIWQCVGMIVGVYGLGYLIAAHDSVRHWPIVLVGLLGKILGPVGFAKALYEGTFPPLFGLNILTNDLMWWIPFAMLLWNAAKVHAATGDDSPQDLRESLMASRSQRDTDLLALSESGPVALFALRHSGCCFCRETLARLRDERSRMPTGMSLAIVTMSTQTKNARLAEEYGLEDAHWVSDPDRRLYRALELRRGSFTQLFGLRVIVRGILSSIRGNSVGSLDGDGFQLPGAFIVHHGEIIRACRAKSAAGNPDFEQMICEAGS